MASQRIKKNKIGYYELVDKPTAKQLENFYKNQYFDSNNFEVKYSDEELFHKTISFIEAFEICKVKTGTMLDIGCGEGFSLDFFSRKGWDVLGLDYSKDGVERHFPNQLNNLRTGDIYQQLDYIQNNSNVKFDLIICNNVLEHLLDPIDFIKRFKSLLSENGIARIQVPNDNSYLQKDAVNKGLAKELFWFAPHEHMSYFTQDSLKELIVHCDLYVVELLGDFPIDFFLFNESSNYLLNSDTGKNCHMARIRLDTLMAKAGSEKLVAFRRGLGNAGLGRNAIIYFSLIRDKNG